MDDLISRQQAIDALENDKAALNQIIRGMSANDAQLDHYVAQHNQVVYDIDAIMQLPPIPPKRGRWEQKDFKYHCSCCDGIAPKAIRWDFCPHCGAKMEMTT